ncbi:MAG: hypothetical protein CSA49_03330, partial [Gammaproteobacteria bacterium]
MFYLSLISNIALCLGITLAFGVQRAYAEESSDAQLPAELPKIEIPSMYEPAIEQDDLSLWQKSTDWLIENRHSLSHGVDNMARGIDHFFAGND